MSDPTGFEKYQIWPVRLRFVRGLDLVSLWGRDVDGNGDEALVARGGRILVSLTPARLVKSVTSPVPHSTSRWKSFAAFRRDAARGPRHLSLRGGLLHDFPKAMETMDALDARAKIPRADLENLLNVLNLLWDASSTVPRMGGRKALVGRTALGRLADDLTFRSAAAPAVWGKAAPTPNTKKMLTFLVGDLTRHCERV